MVLSGLLLLALLPQIAPTAPHLDRYPDVRAILREGEAAATKISDTEDRVRTVHWIASAYAQAGYLDDSARAFGTQSDQWYPLLRARVIYGDLAGAEKSLRRITDPPTKAGADAAVADVFWQMGDSEKARIHFEAGRLNALKIADPEHRKRALTPIEQGLAYLNESPSSLLTPDPHPRPRSSFRCRPFRRSRSLRAVSKKSTPSSLQLARMPRRSSSPGSTAAS